MNKYLKKMIGIIETYYITFFILITCILFINVFWKLGINNLYSWDEARHAVNAYEMLQKHNYLVNTYGYNNDYWNLKPPLSYWAIILGYKIFGFTPLAVRFFSAVSAIITLLIIGFFTSKKFGKLESLITVAVLATSYNFILEHCARTGDADALFVMFFTTSMVAMILSDDNLNWLNVAGVSFAFAFLTKSWHAFSIVVIGGLYLLITKKLFQLKLRNWILFIASSFSPILIWGILRYLRDGSKFFTEMIYYDLLERSSRAIEGHVGGIWYYFDYLRNTYFLWLILFFISLSAYFASLNNTGNNKNLTNYEIGLGLWIIVPLALFSYAKTKIVWYILPLYPPMAICIGALCGTVLKNMNLRLKMLVIIFLVLALGKNELSILSNIRHKQESQVQLMFRQASLDPTVKDKKIYSETWEQEDLLSAELYTNAMPELGTSSFLKDKDGLLFVRDITQSKVLIKKYNLKVVYKLDNTALLRKQNFASTEPTQF